MAKIADVNKVRPVFERRRRMGGQVHHQRAPMQQAARQLEVLDQQLDLHFGDHQVQVATIDRGDFPLGHVGHGHEFELLAQRRREQIVEVIVIVAALQPILEPLMTGMAQALQILGPQHAQGIRAVRFDPPAELFFHHELFEQHDIRGQFADESVETAVVQLDRYFANAQLRQVFLMLASPGGAAEGDVPALLQESPEQLHHIPTGRRRARLGPDVTNDQDFGCAGLIHDCEFLDAARGGGKNARIKPQPANRRRIAELTKGSALDVHRPSTSLLGQITRIDSLRLSPGNW
ncbi:hypothetical protein D3C73_940520 [compost metagenome]